MIKTRTLLGKPSEFRKENSCMGMRLGSQQILKRMPCNLCDIVFMVLRPYMSHHVPVQPQSVDGKGLHIFNVHGSGSIIVIFIGHAIFKGQANGLFGNVIITNIGRAAQIFIRYHVKNNKSFSNLSQNQRYLLRFSVAAGIRSSPCLSQAPQVGCYFQR